jgi:RND family efflux transporter MFP subunit
MREVPRISIRPHIGPACRRLGLGLLAAAIALGCNRAETKQASTAPPPTVGVAQVVQRTVPLIRDFVARTEAVPTVEIRARVAGVLEEVKFREGTEVEQNQILFVIQQAEYKAALQAARAQLAKAEADLTRAKDVSIVDRGRANLDQANAELGKARQDVARYRPLAEAQAIPQQDLDTALSREQAAVANVDAATAAFKDTVLSQRTAIQLSEAAVESAKAAVTQADLNLAYTVVRTPIPGIISKLAVDTGNLVGKGEPTLLATVSALDPIYVDFSITEADYLRLVKRIPGLGRGAVRRDTPARLELIVADATTFPHKGRPVFVDRAIDVKTGTIAVRAEFPNPQRVLRPGQFGRVRAVTDDVPNAVLVPQLAVQELQGAKTVFVVGEGEKVAARTVTLGDAIDDVYIATAGLKPGERVIVEGIQKIRPGMQVTAQPVGTAPGGGGPGATPSAPAGRPKTGS